MINVKCAWNRPPSSMHWPSLWIGTMPPSSSTRTSPRRRRVRRELRLRRSDSLWGMSRCCRSPPAGRAPGKDLTPKNARTSAVRLSAGCVWLVDGRKRGKGVQSLGSGVRLFHVAWSGELVCEHCLARLGVATLAATGRAEAPSVAAHGGRRSRTAAAESRLVRRKLRVIRAELGIVPWHRAQFLVLQGRAVRDGFP